MLNNGICGRLFKEMDKIGEHFVAILMVDRYENNVFAFLNWSNTEFKITLVFLHSIYFTGFFGIMTNKLQKILALKKITE